MKRWGKESSLVGSTLYWTDILITAGETGSERPALWWCWGWEERGGSYWSSVWRDLIRGRRRRRWLDREWYALHPLSIHVLSVYLYSGKELKALIKKQATESSIGHDDVVEEKSPEKQPSWSAVTTATKGHATGIVSHITGTTAHTHTHVTVCHRCVCQSFSLSHTHTDEEPLTSSLKSTGTKREAESQPAASSAQPPAKRSKSDSPNTITAHEVRKYLQRRPMMPKELVKKFSKLKTGMDKQQVVAELGQLLRSMTDVDKNKVKGKMHLSLRSDTSQQWVAVTASIIPSISQHSTSSPPVNTHSTVSHTFIKKFSIQTCALELNVH